MVCLGSDALLPIRRRPDVVTSSSQPLSQGCPDHLAPADAAARSLELERCCHVGWQAIGIECLTHTLKLQRCNAQTRLPLAMPPATPLLGWLVSLTSSREHRPQRLNDTCQEPHLLGLHPG